MKNKSKYLDNNCLIQHITYLNMKDISVSFGLVGENIMRHF